MRWLVTGSGGQLGGHVLARLVSRGTDVLGTIRPGSTRPDFAETEEIDLLDSDAFADLLGRYVPTHIAHLASVSVPRQAERAAAESRGLEETLVRALGDWAVARGAWMLQASTDFTFGGRGGAWHRETDVPAPVNDYGWRKLAGEREVLRRNAGTVARFSWLYGEPMVPRESTYLRLVRQLEAGEPVALIADEYRTPAALPEAARAVVELGIREHRGIMHVGGPERMTPLEFGRRLAARLGTEIHADPIPRARLGERPEDVSLDTSHLRTLLPEVEMNAPFPPS